MAIIRKSTLEFDKWEDYKNALKVLIDRGIYQRFVGFHAEGGGMAHRMHGTMMGPIGYNRFLPWHRAFLVKYEEQVRAVSNDKDFAIPYWDWTQDTIDQLKNFKQFLGTSTVARLINLDDSRKGSFFPETRLKDLVVQNRDNYFSFAKILESGPHNGGHNLIGGSMGTMLSPADPIFWSHHSMVDKVWADWQALLGNKNKMANLDDLDDDYKLDPWEFEFNITNVNDIQSLGENGKYSYSYKTEKRTLEAVPLDPGSQSSP